MKTLRRSVVACALVLVACQGRPSMTLASAAETPPAETVDVRFSSPIQGRAADQYWLVIAPSDAPDSYAETRVFVERMATSARVAAPSTPGTYEVRLHGKWPAKPHHVVERLPLVVRPPETRYADGR